MKMVFQRLIGIFLGLSLFLVGCASAVPVLPPKTSIPTLTPVPLATPESLPPTAQKIEPTPEGCLEVSGSLEKRVIATTLLAKPMRYIVYRPPCYEANQTQRYPVLYLLHGQNYDETQWLRIGAARILDRLIASGKVQPYLIVVPFDYSYKQPSEYKFEEAFTQLLIPEIDLTYRTLTEVSQRAIGGLSRGGAWALRLGLRHPELFGSIGGHSPAIFYADMDTLPTRLLSIPAEQRPRIWLDAGDKDSEYLTVQTFEKLLNKQNLPHEWHTYLGWHDEVYWSAHVEEYLRWYAEAWK